jgi:hypothetical protein
MRSATFCQSRSAPASNHTSHTKCLAIHGTGQPSHGTRTLFVQPISFHEQRMHIWFPAVVLKVCSTCFNIEKKLITHFLYKGRNSARRIGFICRSKSCSPIKDRSRSIATCSMGTPANMLAISSMPLKRP